MLRYRISALLLLVACIGCAANPAFGAALALATGDAAPEIWGRTLEGRRFISDYSAQRFTLVNFWATWCEPCRREMPALQAVHDAVPSGELQIVGLSHSRDGRDEVAAFVADVGATYRIVLPDRGTHEKWGGIGVMPTSFLIGSDGRIVRRYVGASPEQIQAMVGDIEDAIAGRPLSDMTTVDDPDVSVYEDVED